MRVTKRQLRRIIKEELLNEQFGQADRGQPPAPPPDPTKWAPGSSMELETLINSWITRPITVELVRGTTYTIHGVEPAMVPEVTEEVEDFGGTVRAEISSDRSPGLKDLNISLGY